MREKTLLAIAHAAMTVAAAATAVAASALAMIRQPHQHPRFPSTMAWHTATPTTER